MIIWCVLFIDLWKRREAKLRLKWGISKESTRNYVARPQFRGTSHIRDGITDKCQTYSKYHTFGIQALTTTVVLFYLSIFVGCVFAGIYLRDDYHCHYY